MDDHEEISRLRAHVEASEDQEHHFLEQDPLSEKEYALQTLERYAGCSPSLFQPLVLLTNFPVYVEHFAKKHDVPIHEGSMFKVAHDEKNQITICDFKIGSPAAALVIDLLSYIDVEAALMLGLCGGLRRKYKIGEFFMPIAAIRGEGTSSHYFPAEVPAMANFLVSRAVSQVLEEHNLPHHIGITHTTNIRFWEFDPNFKKRLIDSRSQAIEMECATIFISGYFRKLSVGALLLISDLPLERAKSNEMVKALYRSRMAQHIALGEEVLLKARSMVREREIRKQKQK
ncbi:MAG: AMP nucleosidase [Chlamydiia bacterium]